MLTDIRALADHFLIALPNINNGDRPRPTFISAKLDFECKQQLTDL